jgi:benzoyl-CoA reductase/2-hydroxyglutaryl-CoA dehydratase subunit BcrC/BadD/HgdB
VSDITLDWFNHELGKFKEALESNFNVSITDEKLRKAIKLYNESRSLLKELQMLRKSDSPPISGTEMLNTIIAGVSIPIEQFNELITQQIKAIKEREGISNHKARIMLIGSMLDDPEYIKIIEDLGGLVVTDSLCFGTRYFWDNIDESLDPMEGIAKRYLYKASCPRMTDRHAERANYMMDLIKEFNVDGVILQRMKFCAVWWAEIFMLRDRLKEEGIPFLDLEREYVLGGEGQMKTRVQTFMEILE